ncbi:MAG: ribonuclease P protein component [Puniceicoccales bacterium]|nr:ribonuclease P protein component [Puniceicoccales bacterium]
MERESPERRGLRFRRCQRIRLAGDFLEFRRSRTWRGGEYFSIGHKRNCLGTPPRLAVVTSRKVGNAVRRNALRRMVREIFRREQSHLSLAEDWLVRFNMQSRDVPLRQLGQLLRRQLLDLAERWAALRCKSSSERPSN